MREEIDLATLAFRVNKGVGLLHGLVEYPADHPFLLLHLTKGKTQFKSLPHLCFHGKKDHIHVKGEFHLVLINYQFTPFCIGT